MTVSTLFDAHRALLDMADQGQQYRRDQVFYTEENDSNRAEIVGNGFDLERSIAVNLNGTAVETIAQLRVLAMTTGNLFIRLWLNWVSPFGNHRAYACYDLSPAAINALAKQAGASQRTDTPTTTDDAKALVAIFDQFDTQDALGATWEHEYPDFTNEIVEHHGDLVLAARKTEPKLLGMLSDSVMGGVETQEIIDLHDWLSQQR